MSEKEIYVNLWLLVTKRKHHRSRENITTRVDSIVGRRAVIGCDKTAEAHLPIEIQFACDPK